MRGMRTASRFGIQLRLEHRFVTSTPSVSISNQYPSLLPKECGTHFSPGFFCKCALIFTSSLNAKNLFI